MTGSRLSLLVKGKKLKGGRELYLVINVYRRGQEGWWGLVGFISVSPSNGISCYHLNPLFRRKQGSGF